MKNQDLFRKALSPGTMRDTAKHLNELLLKIMSGYFKQRPNPVKVWYWRKFKSFEWCRKYGKLNYPKFFNRASDERSTKATRIKELEKQLEDARLKVSAYEKLYISVTEKEEGISILKKTLPNNCRVYKTYPRKRSMFCESCLVLLNRLIISINPTRRYQTQKY